MAQVGGNLPRPWIQFPVLQKSGAEDVAQWFSCFFSRYGVLGPNLSSTKTKTKEKKRKKKT
jgi:hypothetical protein